MKTILIVDDEPRLLQSIQAGLKIHEDSFSVVTALNGEEAVGMLSTSAIDLVVTDLKMPKMDGFELLAHISTYYPTLPAIVMTAFSTPDIERQIQETRSLKLLEKPIDFDDLASSITEALEHSGEEGSLTGISLSSFLQLIETEQKTCLIEVSSPLGKGYIYFNQGDLYSAVFGPDKAEEAIYSMLMLDDVEIRIKKHFKRRFKKTIETPLLAMLMEGMQRKDEQLITAKDDDQYDLTDSVTGHNGQESIAALHQQNYYYSNQGDENMSELNDTLARLGEIDGFLGAGIFTPNGEMAAQVNNSGLKLDELGSLANEVLLKAQKATDMMDVGRGQVVHIEAPKAQILARCLNENTDFSSTEAGKAHLHMVLILGKDGNLAMATNERCKHYLFRRHL